MDNFLKSTDKTDNSVGNSVTNFLNSLDNKFSNGGSGNSHSSNQFSGDDSNVRKGKEENDFYIDAFILPYIRTEPATNPIRQFLQGIEIGNAIMDIGTEAISGARSSDTTYISGSGRNHSDGTVSVDVIVKGDTSHIQTRNENESKRLRYDPDVKWTKNK